MTIAVIPARGGSKRIPRKNIKNFCGQPIIAYSIQAAQESGLFDRIIVSTDDEEIAEVSRLYGAEIPFMRPKELADDYTGTNAIVKHALKWFRDQNVPVEYACCIYATAPFIQVKYLQQGFDKLISGGKDFVFTVTTFEFPIQRAVKLNQDCEVEPFFPEFIPSRSQDLEEAYHDAAQFYWGKSEAYLNDTSLYFSGSLSLVLPRYLVQDVDTLEDWQQAEFMYHALRAKGNSN
ncbi:MAG: pseudaminic acid cytidylyltransferase [Desulfohalobiaceae bacterium]|nr:pseudaminic acid cytidylyltransferase [Desulfohalobiaceae bacterium]